MTGASGSAYGMRLVEQLVGHAHEVVFIATEAGRQVCAHELGFDIPTVDQAGALKAYLELPADASLRCADPADLFDAVASGSHPVDAMVVAPASMGFTAAVAAGTATNLPERAADVMLKERCPLVLVVRETPLSLVHLRNLTAVTEAGAIVLPASPAFYQRPQTLDDAVNFVVGRVLDVLGIEHSLFERWGSGT
ncbi:MAG: UbiX family flavin prenyltransferase [Coriobacteriales bacterium]|nr:UbiX family flavin prenyltransferase [Coriobacteriales bacterium]